MFQTFSEQLGLFLKNGIISVAEALTLSDSRPGEIAGVIIFATIIFAIWYFLRSSRQLSAIKLLDQKVRAFEGIPEFADGHCQEVMLCLAQYP